MPDVLGLSKTRVSGPQLGRLGATGMGSACATLVVALEGGTRPIAGAARQCRPMRLGATGPALICRDNELARFDTLVADLLAGHGVFVLMSGEAGVGKSRLLTEAVWRAGARGVTTVLGHCVDVGEGVWPLGPLREIVDGLLIELDPAERVAVLGPAAALLGSLDADVTSEPAPLAPTNAGELFSAVLRRVATRGPLLIAVEDVHWASLATQTAISLLARANGHPPIMVICTYRPEELHRQHSWRPALGELIRATHPERVSLAPFDRDGTAAMVSAIDAARCDPATTAEVHRRSGGNAFYIEELIAAANDGVSTTESLRDTVLGRLALLSEDATRVVQALAVGRAAPSHALAELCDLDDATLDAALAELRPTALVIADDPGLRFRHELVREVIEGELPAADRHRLHGRWASALEHLLPDRLGDIARHWAAAGIPDEALPASLSAGRAALRAGAPGEAECHLRRALELWDDVHGPSDSDPDRALVLFDASVAARHASHLDVAETLGLRAAHALHTTDPRQEGIVWLHLRDVYRDLRSWDACDEAVHRALASIPPEPASAERAEALADEARNHWYSGHGPQARALAEQAIDVAEASGDRRALVLARTAFAAAQWLLGNPVELAFAEKTVSLCRPELAPETALFALKGLAMEYGRLGREADRMTIGRRGVELARAHGIGGCAMTMAVYWIGGAAQLGRWREAERQMAQLEDLLTAEGEMARAWGLPLVRQGRLAEAAPLMEAGRTRSESGDLEFSATTAAALVQFDAASGRLLDAARRARAVLATTRVATVETAELVDAAIAVVADGLQGICQPLARAAAAERSIALASSWLELLERSPTAQWRGDRIGRIYVDEARAHLTRLLGAPEPPRWAAVADSWAEVGYPWEEANARMHHAEAQLAGIHGRRTAARGAAAGELDRALILATELGAQPLVAAITRLARSGGLNDDHAGSRDRSSDGLGLTQREQRVLELLAEGQTNGQIARALFISTKTASVHVSNILRKLGVANRFEAAAVAGRADGPAAGDRRRSFVDWLHEVADRPGADLAPVGDAVDNGVTEMEPDEDPGLTVLPRGVGDPTERTQHG